MQEKWVTLVSYMSPIDRAQPILNSWLCASQWTLNYIEIKNPNYFTFTIEFFFYLFYLQLIYNVIFILYLNECDAAGSLWADENWSWYDQPKNVNNILVVYFHEFSFFLRYFSYYSICFLLYFGIIFLF